MIVEKDKNSPLNLSFPLTTDGKHDEAIRNLLRIAAMELYKTFSNQGLVAICLGGSLGRGEGSVVVFDGVSCMLSDFDFTLVVRDKKSASKINRNLHAFLMRLNNLLSGRGLKSYVDCGVMVIESLHSIKDTLFWLEFCQTAKTLFSNDPNFSLPSPSIKNVDSQETIILLNNRIIEQLKYVKFDNELHTAACNKLDMEIYLCSRTYADLGKALLLFYSRYAFCSLERIELLKSMVEEGIIEKGVFERIRFWTNFKLKPDMGKIISKYKVAISSEYISTIKKELANDLISIWMTIGNTLFCSEHQDSLPILLTKVRVKPMARTLKSWVVFLAKGNRSFSGIRLIPLKVALQNLHRVPPIWLSYLPGILLYASVVAERFDFREMERRINKYIDSSGKLHQNSILSRQEYYKNKIIRVWDYIAMGGRHVKNGIEKSK